MRARGAPLERAAAGACAIVLTHGHATLVSDQMVLKCHDERIQLGVLPLVADGKQELTSQLWALLPAGGFLSRFTEAAQSHTWRSMARWGVVGCCRDLQVSLPSSHTMLMSLRVCLLVCGESHGLSYLQCFSMAQLR